MVHAKLHIICGNCGSNNMFKLSISKELNDLTEKEEDVAYLICENCNTIHDLEDNAEKETNNL